jgi:hypothetical protein
VPGYRPTLTLRNIQLSPTAKTTVLGTNAKCSWKQEGKNIRIDLKELRPGDISPTGIFVIKLEGAIKKR